MRRVEQIMGLPVSIDIPEAKNGGPFEAAFERLRQIDERFSTYRADSEVSMFRRGELAEPRLSIELAKVLHACRQWQAKTNGYFSAWYDRQFDPSGYVKGWAIAEAGQAIEASGYKTYCIGAGGDILARSAGAKVWNIGIQDPADPTKILNKLSISNGAVATSGNYERGEHIINPKSKQPARELLSVTISGPDIITADVLATTVFAMGHAGEEFIKEFPDYRAQVVSRRNRGSSR